MKYVASCSFGKDSLAMLIKIKELGLPLDEVIYCEVMFDDEISGETPEMYQFINKAEKTLNIRHISSVYSNDKYRHSAGGYIWRYANDRNS